MKRISLSWIILPVTSMAIVAAAVVVGGCNPQSAPQETAAPTIDVSRTTQNGPVQVTVDADRTSAQIAERVEMTLDVRAPQGVAIRFPESADAMGEFDVMKVSDQLDIPDGEERRWTRTYELESLASGEHVIPAIDVHFTDRRSGAAVADVVQSEPIEMQIVSVLEGQADPLAFRDIKGEVEIAAPTESDRTWIAYSLGGGFALALAAIGLVVWQRRRNNLSPAERALAELNELEQSELLQQGLVEEFYCSLTDIVRRYLERQFAIDAPLLTTEEFLAAMQHERALDATYRESLGEFLTVADMVKFARFEPGSSEATETIDVARQFVTSTAEHDRNENAQPSEVAA